MRFILKTSLFLVLTLLSVESWAKVKKSNPALSPALQEAVPEEVFQVIFELNDEALTTIDFKNYLSQQKALKADGFWPQQNDLNEFLMMEICYLEAQNLDLKIKKTDSASLVSARYQLAKEFLSLKEKQFSAPERYQAWFELLKRKYNFSVKSDEARAYFRK